MNRIEKLREFIDAILLNMNDTEERRCGYIHLYGVAQACAMIANKRNLNAELATMAGMLHDLYSYQTMIRENHAHMGAALAKEILEELKITDKKETEMIYTAIYHHSDKGNIHTDFDEALKDADVFQHSLYNVTIPAQKNEKVRYMNLLKEFGII